MKIEKIKKFDGQHCETTATGEVSKYRAKKTKDSLHFMLDKPLPLELIKKIIKLKSKL